MLFVTMVLLLKLTLSAFIRVYLRLRYVFEEF